MIEFLPHLNCDVEFNVYDDGTFTLECNTCCKILMSVPFEPESEPIPDNEYDSETVNATFPPELETPALKIPQIEEAPDDNSDI